jgi:hypothetical protein
MVENAVRFINGKIPRTKIEETNKLKAIISSRSFAFGC